MKQNETKQSKLKKTLIVLGGALVSILIFKAGMNYEATSIGKGLNTCFAEDPSLKEHLVDTMLKAEKKIMM